MTTVANLLVKLQGDASGLVSASAQGAASLGGLNKAAKALALGGVAALAAGFAAVSVASIKAAADFDKGMREVNTLVRGSEEQFADLKQETLDFQKELGITAGDAVPALYQAISAGVPRDNVFEFLEVAGRASIGGVTDLATAVDGLTSVTNAYGRETISAERAADIMFTAVRLGKTTFGELSGSLFNVIPIAAATGVEFEQVAAALAALTAQGTPTTVATTQLRAAIQALSAPTVRQRKLIDQLGLDFSAARLSQIGLSAAFKEAIDATGGNMEVLRKLIGSVEGLQAVLALGGDQSALFDDALVQMESSAGANIEAFEEMEKSTSRLYDRLKAQLEVILIQIGDILLPRVNEALIIFSDWVSEHEAEIIDAFDRTFKKIADVADEMQRLADIFKGPVKVVFDFAISVPPEVWLVGAAAAAAVGLWPLALVFAAAAGISFIGGAGAPGGGGGVGGLIDGTTPGRNSSLDALLEANTAGGDGLPDFADQAALVRARLGFTIFSSAGGAALRSKDLEDLGGTHFRLSTQALETIDKAFAQTFNENIFTSVQDFSTFTAELGQHMSEGGSAAQFMHGWLKKLNLAERDVALAAMEVASGGGGALPAVTAALTALQQASLEFARSQAGDVVEALQEGLLISKEVAAENIAGVLLEQAERQKAWETHVNMAKEMGFILNDINRAAFEELLDQEKALADSRIDEIRRVREEQMGQAVSAMMQMQGAAMSSGIPLTQADIDRLNNPENFNFSGTPLDFSTTNAGQQAPAVQVSVQIGDEVLADSQVRTTQKIADTGRDR